MRAAATLLPLVPLLAACSDAAAPASCPGEPVAAVAFAGGLVPAQDPAIAGLDPVPGLPDCDAGLGHPPALELSGTLARAETGAGAALCTPGGQILLGTASGDRWSVAQLSTGAVLEGCGTACAATSRTWIVGDLLRGGDGSPSGFSGALVEVLEASDPACGACALPCAARYALQGAVEGG